MTSGGGNVTFLPLVIRIILHIKTNDYEATEELHAMAYWQGDTCHDVLLTDRDEE